MNSSAWYSGSTESNWSVGPSAAQRSHPGHSPRSCGACASRPSGRWRFRDVKMMRPDRRVATAAARWFRCPGSAPAAARAARVGVRSSGAQRAVDVQKRAAAAACFVLLQARGRQALEAVLRHQESAGFDEAGDRPHFLCQVWASSGTTTRPAATAPKYAMPHSGWFSLNRTTRSPRSSPMRAELRRDLGARMQVGERDPLPVPAAAHLQRGLGAEACRAARQAAPGWSSPGRRRTRAGWRRAAPSPSNFRM